MRSLLLRGLVPLVAASGLLAGAVLGLTAVTASAHHGHHVAHHARGRPGESNEGSMTLFVSPTGATSNSGESCAGAQYSTIQSAVTAPRRRSTVIVCPGTYAEDVAVAKALTLEGQDAVINATGQNNGIVDHRLERIGRGLHGPGRHRRGHPRRGHRRTRRSSLPARRPAASPACRSATSRSRHNIVAGQRPGAADLLLRRVPGVGQRAGRLRRGHPPDERRRLDGVA